MKLSDLLTDGLRAKSIRGGADDFVVKPIRINPLIARIEAVLRRVTGITPPDEAELPLRNGAKAYCSNRKIVLSAENLLLNVRNVSPTEDRLCCVRYSISRLRLKLEDLAEIKTYYGEGYRFEV